MAADRSQEDQCFQSLIPDTARGREPLLKKALAPSGDSSFPPATDREADSGTEFRLPESELERMFDEACNVALPEKIGRYCVLSILGSGGMGVVYRAEQDWPHRLVALKTLKLGLADRRMTARFENEIASLARLRHPNIAQIYDAGVAPTSWGRQPYIAMELIDGPRLMDYVQRRELPVPERLGLFARICDAVEHAHQRGVIHRDLKPANILVIEEGPAERRPCSGPERAAPCATPKVLDFGVARLVHADQSQSAATNAGEILGTLAYMSPEQASGSSDAINVRSDVYSLGCILYELLGERPPLDLAGLSVASASRRIANDRPPPLRVCRGALRGDLEIIVARALEKDPERRYASAAALAADVRAYLACEPIAARKPSPLYFARKWIGRHRVVCALGGVAAASLALGAIGLVNGLARSERARQSRQHMIGTLLESVNGIATDVLPRMASIAGTGETRRELLAKLAPTRDLLRNLRGNDPKLMATEADVLDAIASLESDFSDAQARLRARQAVLDARRRLIEAVPDDRKQMRRFAIDHVRIGDIVQEMRDVAGAERWYRQAFDIQNLLLCAEPDNVDAQIALTWSHARLAHTANRLDRPDELLGHLQAAETLLERLRSRTAGADEIRLLDCRQQCLALWCDFYTRKRQPDEAQRVQRLRIDCLKRLIELDSSNCVYLVRAAGAIVNTAGEDLLRLGNCQSAAQGLAGAESVLQQLRRLEPFNAEACEARANAKHIAAMLEAAEGRPEAALQRALSARRLLLAQIEQSPWTPLLSQLDENANLIAEYAAACGVPELGDDIRHENYETLFDLGDRAAPAVAGAPIAPTQP